MDNKDLEDGQEDRYITRSWLIYRLIWLRERKDRVLIVWEGDLSPKHRTTHIMVSISFIFIFNMRVISVSYSSSSSSYSPYTTANPPAAEPNGYGRGWYDYLNLNKLIQFAFAFVRAHTDHSPPSFLVDSYTKSGPIFYSFIQQWWAWGMRVSSNSLPYPRYSTPSKPSSWREILSAFSASKVRAIHYLHMKGFLLKNMPLSKAVCMFDWKYFIDTFRKYCVLHGIIILYCIDFFAFWFTIFDRFFDIQLL